MKGCVLDLLEFLLHDSSVGGTEEGSLALGSLQLQQKLDRDGGYSVLNIISHRDDCKFFI